MEACGRTRLRKLSWQPGDQDLDAAAQRWAAYPRLREICIHNWWPRPVPQVPVSLGRLQQVKRFRFLNTAWTLQIARGAAMWLAACALAWPVAHYYENPLLLWLLPIAGLDAQGRTVVALLLLAVAAGLAARPLATTQLRRRLGE